MATKTRTRQALLGIIAQWVRIRTAQLHTPVVCPDQPPPPSYPRREEDEKEQKKHPNLLLALLCAFSSSQPLRHVCLLFSLALLVAEVPDLAKPIHPTSRYLAYLTLP